MRAHEACVRASEAGSLRRRVETVGDIDLIAASDDAAALIGWFCEQAIAASVVGRGDTKGSIVTHDGVQVDLRVVPPAAYGNLLQHFTGSKAHNVAMREDAVKRGLKVSEWGIETVETGEVFQTDDEDEVYRRLGYQPIPPEIREGTTELARARAGHDPDAGAARRPARRPARAHRSPRTARRRSPRWSRRRRPRGSTTWRSRITRPGSAWGSGSSPTQVQRHVEQIREYAAGLDGFTLLAGAEVDVMVDGSLYYDDDLLAGLDWVVASLHVGQRQDSERATSRLLAAIENPHVDVVAHPSGRLLGAPRRVRVRRRRRSSRRPPGTGTFLEINCGPRRLDLRPAHATAAIEAGVKLADLDGRPPGDLVRAPRPRRGRGAPGLGDPGRHREHAALGRARRHAQAPREHRRVSVRA